MLRVKDKDALKFVGFFMKNAESSISDLSAQTVNLMRTLKSSSQWRKTCKA